MSVTKIAQPNPVIGPGKTLGYLTKGRVTDLDQITGYAAREKSRDVLMINRPTKAQRKRWGLVADLGCIVCGNTAEIHHCHTSMGCRKNHDLVIPLCCDCHRGGYGVGIHGGKAEFEARNGTEAALLEKVSRLVDV